MAGPGSESSKPGRTLESPVGLGVSTTLHIRLGIDLPVSLVEKAPRSRLAEVEADSRTGYR